MLIRGRVDRDCGDLHNTIGVSSENIQALPRLPAILSYTSTKMLTAYGLRSPLSMSNRSDQCIITFGVHGS